MADGPFLFSFFNLVLGYRFFQYRLDLSHLCRNVANIMFRLGSNSIGFISIPFCKSHENNNSNSLKQKDTWAGGLRQCGRGHICEYGQGVWDTVVACTSSGVAVGLRCDGCKCCGGIDRLVARMAPEISVVVAYAVTAL